MALRRRETAQAGCHLRAFPGHLETIKGRQRGSEGVWQAGGPKEMKKGQSRTAPHMVRWDTRSFVELLLEGEPPPCIHPKKCALYELCAAQQMACDSFRRYVSYSGEYDPKTLRIPSKRYFRMAMGIEEFDYSHLRKVISVNG